MYQLLIWSLSAMTVSYTHLKATVTITYTNGSRRIFQVKVQKGIVKTTSVSVNKRNIILARKGKSFQLKVTLTPVTSQQKVTRCV